MRREDRLYTRDRPTDQRTQGQRDRDRILYTSAFRRLAGITQVVSPAEGHVFHNRLTHSLEVAQVGRRLAEKLVREQENLVERLGGLDPDTVEAACLAHDVGHPPFGHIGESELDDLVFAAGVADGFEGNAQSFRVVTKLAIRHEEFPGLNLTRATLNAILKYPWHRDRRSRLRIRKFGAYRSEAVEFRWARKGQPSGVRTTEAEIMDWADDVTYAVHDVEDFYRAGLIPLDKLIADDQEIDKFLGWVFARWRAQKKVFLCTEKECEKIFKALVLGMPVTEIYRGTRAQRASLRTVTASLIARYINGISLAAPEDSKARVTVEDWARVETDLLKELVWFYVITNPSLATQQYGQRRVLRELFEIFLSAGTAGLFDIFPTRYQERLVDSQRNLKDEPLRHAIVRTVADLIAAMADLEIMAVHQRLTGRTFGSISDALVR